MPKRKQVKITIGRDMNGKLIRKSFSDTSIRKARAKAEEYKEKLKYGMLTDDSVTFRTWAETWLETYVTGVSQTTYNATYKNTVNNHLVAYFDNAKVADIKPVHIQRFFNSKTECSGSLLHKCDFILRSIFEQAVDNEIIYKSPYRNIKIPVGKAPAKRLVYTAAQEQTHIEFAKTHEHGLLAILPLKTSVSRSEAAALLWSDFDRKENTLHISKGMNQLYEVGPGKTKHRKRYVPYDAELAELIGSAPRTGMYVFCRADGTPIGPDSLERLYNEFRKDLLAAHTDMPKLTYHELRHTYATRRNEEGVPDNTIALLMGHGKDSKITNEVYIHQNILHIKKTLGLMEENDVSSKCPHTP